MKILFKLKKFLMRFFWFLKKNQKKKNPKFIKKYKNKNLKKNIYKN